MTAPKNARKRGAQRFYEWRGENFWSVTTILSGGLPKPALINWAKKFTSEYAVDNFDKLTSLLEPDAEGNIDRDGAIDWLKSAAFRSRDKAADLGSLIHATAEAHVLGKPTPPWPVTAKPRMKAFLAFLDEYEPTYLATEASVYNRTERYAGTLDAIVEIDGRRLLLDTKTGKGVYPDVALQLAAYRFAEFIGLADGSEAPMHEVDACAVLHLPEDGTYRLVDVRADEEVFKTFLYVREVFRFQEETAKSVLLGPVARGEVAEATLPLAEALAKGGA